MIFHFPNPLDLFNHAPKPAAKPWPTPPKTEAATWASAPVETVAAQDTELIEPERVASVDLVPAALNPQNVRELAPNASFHIVLPPTPELATTDLHALIKETQTMATAATAFPIPATQKSAVQKVEGFLTKIGQFFKNDVAKGLGWAVQYAPSVAALASLIIPGAAGASAAVVSAFTLIQNAVISIEQKYAASGVQTGTGSQKLAEVLALVEPAVTSLLKQEGVNADTSFITNITNIVVGILNIHPLAV